MSKVKKVSIDGKALRQWVDSQAGRKCGTYELCRRLNIKPEGLNKMMLEGKATAKTIMYYQKAGILIPLCDNPVPCRLKREHTQQSRKSTDEHQPTQMSIEESIELTRLDKMKEIMIAHLTAMIEEIEKI